MSLPNSNPLDNEEMYLDEIANPSGGYLPRPKNNKEMYLKYIAENGTGAKTVIRNTIAEDYDSTETYTEGARVFMDGVLKKLVNGSWVDAEPLVDYKLTNKDLSTELKQKLLTAYPLTDGTITLDDIIEILEDVNDNGEHVFFDTSSLSSTMTLCTIYVDDYEDPTSYKVVDTTGKTAVGTYSSTKTLSQILAEAVEAYVSITVTAQTNTGVTVTGKTVTLRAGSSEAPIIASRTYNGQPVTFVVAKNDSYYISMSDFVGYVTPSPVIGMATSDASILMTYRDAVRYGFRRTKAESDCVARITYLYDAVGMTPAYMDYTTNEFNYGSWENFVEAVARPVMLKMDGTVDYELDRSNQNYKADGVTLSDIVNTSYNGNAMVEFGTYKWVKRWEDENYEYVVFSNAQYDSDYHAYAHTNDDGEIQDAFYLGIFPGPYDSASRLRSIGTGGNAAGQNAMTEVSRATVLGDGYNILYKSAWDFVADLCTLISKTDDSQTAFGNGVQGQSGISTSVTDIAAGPFWGRNDNVSPVKVFWIHNFWGNMWQRMNGCVLDGMIYTKMVGPYPTPSTDATCHAGFDNSGIVPGGSSGGGTNTHSTTDTHGYLGKTASGTYATYIPDSLYFNVTQVDFALVGGGYAAAAGRGGSRSLDLADLASAAPADYGARLSYIPA